MLALTIHQPYAGLIAEHKKRVENRKWYTAVRERIAIHAGKSTEWLETYRDVLPELHFGAIVATAEIYDCVKLDDVRLGKYGSRYDWLLGDRHASGPYCFLLAHIRPLPEPIEVRGNQGFWEYPTDQLPASVR